MTWPIDGEKRFAAGIHEAAGRHYVVWHEGIVSRIAGPVRNVFDVHEVHRLMAESARREIERLDRKLRAGCRAKLKPTS